MYAKSSAAGVALGGLGVAILDLSGLLTAGRQLDRAWAAKSSHMSGEECVKEAKAMSRIGKQFRCPPGSTSRSRTEHLG